MTFGGVIYLHDISQTRMLGTTRKNFDIFRKLCGEGTYGSVILGSTKWAAVSPEVGAQREGELIDTFWKEIIFGGSRTLKFENTRNSAWNIINAILDKFEDRSREHAPSRRKGDKKAFDPDTLLIQTELVDLQRLIPETEAGKTLRYTLQELYEMQVKMGQKLKAQSGNAELMAQLEENRGQIRRTLSKIKDLKVPLSRRIVIFFGLKVSFANAS
jgi:hypothetical protein